MKFITFALIYYIIFGSTVHLAISNSNCANHPIFNLAQSFLKRTVQDDELGAKVMEFFINEFSNATPQTRTASELGVCSQFSGMETCCTEAMTDFFDKVATFTGEAIQRIGNPLTKLIQLMKQILIVDGCSTKLETMSDEDIFSNTANPLLKDFYDLIKESQLAFSKIVAAINRGSLCSICVGVDVVNDYISSGQVYVLSSSLTEFYTAYLSSWNLISSTFKNYGWMEKVKVQFFQVYGTELCDISYFETFSEEFDKNYSGGTFAVENNNNPSGYACSGLVLFNQRPKCETCQVTIIGLDEIINNYEQLRFLTEDVEDAISSEESAIGVSMYLPSQTDEKMIGTGENQVSFEGFISDPILEPSVPEPSDPKTSAASTSINRLYLGVYLVIFSLFNSLI